MLYTEKEKHEIERVKEVFAEHLRQSPDFELLWSDKVGYLMKKSLTTCLWKNSQVDPDFLWCASCRVRHCRAA